MFNNNKDFDFDLSKGKLNEKSIATILGLSEDKFECKHERDFWKVSCNLCIEIESYGKKSGLKSTKAKYWCHSFNEGDHIIGLIVIEVSVLKQIVKKFLFKNKNNLKKIVRMLGDNRASKCVLIPMSEFIDLWRKINVKKSN